MCWSKLLNFFRGKPMDSLKGRKQRILEPVPRYAAPGKRGLNMPMYQPCPQCSAGSKRDYKTSDGAIYQCTHCPFTFLIRRPERIPNIPVFQHSK